MSSDFQVTFYGCRGSYPMAGPATVRYGGATSCVVVRAGTRDIIFDAGTGIASYSRAVLSQYFRERAPVVSYLFLSHLHLDHIMGLPFYAPLYMPDATVYMWGPRSQPFASLRESVANIIAAPYLPVDLDEMQAHKVIDDLFETEVVYFLHGQTEPVKLRPCHPLDQHRLPAPELIEASVHMMRGYNHPKNGVSIYKVIYQGRSVVFATDTEGFVHGDRRLMRFADQADLLIHDAMYPDSRYVAFPSTQGYGHSTVEIAAKVAAEAHVRQLALFHHDPLSSDDDLDQFTQNARAIFPNTLAASDGLVLDLATKQDTPTPTGQR